MAQCNYVGRGDFDAEHLMEVLKDYFVTFGDVEAFYEFDDPLVAASFHQNC